MTARAEATKVRLSKEAARRRAIKQQERQALANSAFQTSDERETRASSRGNIQSTRQRRDRVAPEGPRRMKSESSSKQSNDNSNSKSLDNNTKNNGNGVTDSPRSKRRKSKSKKNIKVDTKLDSQGDWSPTPNTAASSSPTTPGVRGDSDYRSPGQRKTPKVASEEPVPDFITQTDRFGNASTPRSQKAIEKARQLHPAAPKPHLHVGRDGRLHEDDDKSVDACAETLLDSLRLMCCCLMPDESSPQVVKSQVTEEEVLPEEEVERPRLLPRLHPDDQGKPCLVLDLDETLVHSSFRAVPGADFVIPVQIEDVVHFVYVAKRPGVDEFLTEMAKHYEIVIYTASLNKYADPLLDLLDPNRVIRTRLFRESCVYYEGNYVKDLSLLDRDLTQTIIIDNSPSSYVFHPENAIDCSSFIEDPADRELDQIAAFLTGIRDINDVRHIAPQWRDWPNVAIHDQ